MLKFNMTEHAIKLKSFTNLSTKYSSGTSIPASPIEKSRWTRMETLDTEFAEKILFYSIALSTNSAAI